MSHYDQPTYTAQNGDYRMSETGSVTLWADNCWVVAFSRTPEQVREYLELKGCMIVHRDGHHYTYWRQQ